MSRAARLEWRTGCGVVDLVHPPDEDGYTIGDWEPCLYCEKDGCVAVVSKSGGIPLPRKPPRKTGESDIVRRIREAVGKLPGVVLWRSNTGVLEDRNGTKVRFGLCPGAADLVGMVRCSVFTTTPSSNGRGEPFGIGDIARFLAIEVKKPGKKPTVEQSAFLALVNKMGGHGAWVDSVAGALAEVEKARAL